MPCYDGGYIDTPRTEYRTPPEVKERLDRATHLLCSLLKEMNDEEVTQLSDEMQVWWAKHQVEDRKREVAEAKREKQRLASDARIHEVERKRDVALSKLTAEDRDALGVV